MSSSFNKNSSPNRVSFPPNNGKTTTPNKNMSKTLKAGSSGTKSLITANLAPVLKNKPSAAATKPSTAAASAKSGYVPTDYGTLSLQRRLDYTLSPNKKPEISRNTAMAKSKSVGKLTQQPVKKKAPARPNTT